MKNGYVAFLDVLGFRATVEGHDATSRIGRYRNVLQSVLQAPGQSTPLPLQASVFSDSIILAMVEGQESLADLVTHASRLFGEMLKAGIALRGAIAFGPYDSAELPGGTFFAGPAITEAYRFEAAQDWVGIMLAPSVIDQTPDVLDRCNIGVPGFKNAERFNANEPRHQLNLRQRMKFAAALQPCGSIPFHQTSAFDVNIYEGFAIVPANDLSKPLEIRRNLVKYLEHLERLKSVAPDPPAQRKYEETMRWLRPIEVQWSTIARSEELLEADGKLPPATGGR